MSALHRLDRRVAVVVGAGQTPGETVGNGRATAITFARAGARVVIVDREQDRAASTAEAIGAETDADTLVIVADVRADDGPATIVDTACDAFGGIDILHNNVGIGTGDAPAHHLADDVYDRIMDVNLRAMWRTCRAAVPVLRRSEHGAIVNVSSVAAIASVPALTAYTISKAGVNALTRNLAMSNARHGVRVNAIMPGLVDTPMGVDGGAAARGIDRADYAASRAERVPLGRQGTAWDVANAALFLASDEASWITGVVLPVDGGQSCRVG